VFGRWLQSGAKEEAAPIPLPRLLSHAHQVLSDSAAAILREWEALESEHQRLSDWRTQLEERTRTASCQFVAELPELFQLKCPSPASEARPHLNGNNPSIPRI
jgi:hypothetical protein